MVRKKELGKTLLTKKKGGMGGSKRAGMWENIEQKLDKRVRWRKRRKESAFIQTSLRWALLKPNVKPLSEASMNKVKREKNSVCTRSSENLEAVTLKREEVYLGDTTRPVDALGRASGHTAVRKHQTPANLLGKEKKRTWQQRVSGQGREKWGGKRWSPCFGWWKRPYAPGLRWEKKRAPHRGKIPQGVKKRRARGSQSSTGEGRNAFSEEKSTIRFLERGKKLSPGLRNRGCRRARFQGKILKWHGSQAEFGSVMDRGGNTKMTCKQDP